MKKYTAESVTEGHPDKVCDIIADSVLEMCIRDRDKVIATGDTTIENNPYLGFGELPDMGETSELNIEAIIGLAQMCIRDRYYALNLHSVFYRGTLEWRCFESTLHAGVARANITLALAISAQAINQTRTLAKKTPVTENPAFTFRTFLLRLGLVGEEYKNVRMHLLKDLPGDPAWRCV